MSRPLHPSQKKLVDYRWPQGPLGQPVWKGDHFAYTDGSRVSVVAYEKGSGNWSEELTDLHEKEVGLGDHPIDLASRHLAVCSVVRHQPEKHGIILEIGCSSGYLLRDLKAKFPGRPLIGADYISGPLEKLSALIPGIPLLQFDLKACPLPDNSVSVVTNLNVLEHIDDDELALRQIYRVLEPGGVAHIEVPACPSCYDIYDECLLHFRRYAKNELVHKARKAGFEVVSQTYLGALIFPAFYIVKRLNRLKLKSSPATKSDWVRKQMRLTRQSFMMKQVMKLELFLGRWISYPTGIRNVVILKKPPTPGTPGERINQRPVPASGIQ